MRKVGTDRRATVIGSTTRRSSGEGMASSRSVETGQTTGATGMTRIGAKVLAAIDQKASEKTHGEKRVAEADEHAPPSKKKQKQ